MDTKKVVVRKDDTPRSYCILISSGNTIKKNISNLKLWNNLNDSIDLDKEKYENEESGASKTREEVEKNEILKDVIDTTNSRR